MATLAGRADIPDARRRDVARLLEDLTASDTGGWYSLVSLHGGGSPEAMKREIWRSYPVEDRVALIDRLIERGVAGPEAARDRQPGRCCPVGCQEPAHHRGEADESAQPASQRLHHINDRVNFRR